MDRIRIFYLTIFIGVLVTSMVCMILFPYYIFFVVLGLFIIIPSNMAFYQNYLRNKEMVVK